MATRTAICSPARFNPWMVGFTMLWLVSFGCGSDTGVARFERTGTVYFEGQPVNRGEILFAPDREQGNSGPGATADVADGRFRTTSGKGTVSGSHILTISGFDGKAPRSPLEAEMHPWGKILFVEREVRIDFPDHDSSHEIVIPTEAP